MRKLIHVDEEKCSNCHNCISSCPVKFCNDSSGNYVKINENLCIGCGNCVQKCTHKARTFNDDIHQLVGKNKRHQKTVAIIAPAIATYFPKTYLHLNGWLESLGIKAYFDVSFGAELTIKSYLEEIKKQKVETLIAQPCPVVVNYIEIYQPQLIKYLAPVDSPMMHTIKMIKHFYPEYQNHKIVVISPCATKKQEFDSVREHVLNVTFDSIHEYLKNNQIQITAYPAIEYTNPRITSYNVCYTKLLRDELMGHEPLLQPIKL